MRVFYVGTDNHPLSPILCSVLLRVHTSRSFTIALLMFGVSGLCRRSAMDVSPRPKSLGATASLPHGACAGAQHPLDAQAELK